KDAETAARRTGNLMLVYSKVHRSSAAELLWQSSSPQLGDNASIPGHKHSVDRPFTATHASGFQWMYDPILA
ncbi:hypothetical protein FRC18_008900, partial [Serendipita sp. 400]